MGRERAEIEEAGKIIGEGKEREKKEGERKGAPTLLGFLVTKS